MTRHIALLGSVLTAVLFATGYSFADEQKKQHNIAVVSEFETTMYKIRIGLTIFNNSEESLEVASWHIAETSEAELVALLKQRESLAGDNIQVLPQSGARARAGEQTRAAQAAVIQAARDAGFDTLVLILPYEIDDYRLFKPGYGVVAIGHITGLDVCAYASFEVIVYRTSDAERIDWNWGHHGSCSGFDNGPDVPWKDSLAEYGDADLATVEAAVKTRIRKWLEHALDGLKLE